MDKCSVAVIVHDLVHRSSRNLEEEKILAVLVRELACHGAGAARLGEKADNRATGGTYQGNLAYVHESPVCLLWRLTFDVRGLSQVGPLDGGVGRLDAQETGTHKQELANLGMSLPVKVYGAAGAHCFSRLYWSAATVAPSGLSSDMQHQNFGLSRAQRKRPLGEANALHRISTNDSGELSLLKSGCI